jgi:hypothetical protein
MAAEIPDPQLIKLFGSARCLTIQIPGARWLFARRSGSKLEGASWFASVIDVSDISQGCIVAFT